jgi:hypothetical protein
MDVLLPIERRVYDVLSSFSTGVASGLLHVLTLESPEERGRTMGRIWEAQELRPLANLLLDLEAEPTARAFVTGMLLELERRDERLGDEPLLIEDFE